MPQEVAAWNKAKNKIELLSDLERQITNAQLQGSPELWIKYLRAFIVLIQTYLKKKDFLERLDKIEDTLAGYNHPGMMSQLAKINYRVFQRKALRELTQIQCDLADAVKDANLDITLSKEYTEKERVRNAIR